MIDPDVLSDKIMNLEWLLNRKPAWVIQLEEDHQPVVVMNITESEYRKVFKGFCFLHPGGKR